MMVNTPLSKCLEIAVEVIFIIIKDNLATNINNKEKDNLLRVLMKGNPAEVPKVVIDTPGKRTKCRGRDRE